MSAFLIRRLFQGLLALVGLMVVVFFLLHLNHASPAYAILGRQATPAKVAALNAKLGLSLPVPIQFVLWLRAALLYGGIGSDIAHVLPPTLELLGLGVALALVVSILIARLQAWRPRSILDRGLAVLLSLLSAIPGFWMGTLLMFVFAIVYPIFPASATLQQTHGIGPWAYHQVLPVVTLALTTIGPWTRHLRAGLGQEVTQQYVRTARAKGVSDGAIVRHHTFRNALMPLATLVGLSFPTMLNTIIAIEIIYGVQGAGWALIGALNGLAISEATSIALVLALVTVLGSILADTAYGIIDPRVQYR